MKHFFRQIITAAAFAVMMSAGLSAQQMQNLPLDPAVRHGVLENGLTYYIRHNEEPKDRAFFYIAQKVGSVQEEESQRGLAHFLEHMCFNGSEHFKGDGALVKYCESIGVQFGRNLNAYTSTDETVYRIDAVPVTPGNVDSCLFILRDWADGLLLLDSEIDKERGVIHEEWRMRTNGQQRILNRVLPKIYPGSRYGYRMPIGLMSVVDNFSPKELRDYYETWYRPDLQGIVIVGDINVDEIEAKVKDLFGSIKPVENPKPYVDYPVPDNDEAIYAIDSDKEISQPIIIISLKQDPMPREMRNTPVYYAQDYILDAIGQVINSRLNELSQKPDCPFLGAGVGYGKYLIAKTKDAVEINIVPKPGMDAAAVQAVMQEVERARRFGLTGTEVFRAREEILSRLEKAYNNRNKRQSSTYVHEYVRNFLDNSPACGIETEYAILKSYAPQVPAEAFGQVIAQMCQSYEKNFVLLAMYPEKEGVAIPTEEALKAAVNAAAGAELTAYVDNVKNEPFISVLPKKGKVKKSSEAAFGYTKLALSNGANVYYKKTDFNESEVIMSAYSKGGLSLIPDADLINASLVTPIINASGIGNFNSVELDKALAGKQVRCNINLGQFSEGLSGNATPKDLQTLFELIYLRFQAPADDPDAYNNYINNMRSQLENAEKLPLTAFSDSIQTTVYGKNPRLVRIKLPELAKADYAKIKEIYSQRFANAADFDFYFTGNFDEAQLKEFVEQYIASLPKKGKRESYFNWNISPLEGACTNRFNRKMETPQAYMLQVWSGKDKYTLKESTTVEALGTILSQRYLKSIREDGGMSYSVQTMSSLNYGTKEEYIMQTICPFTPALVDSVLYCLDKGIKDISAEGVTVEELETIRKYELKNYADNQRKNGYWQDIIMSLNNWGKDDHTGYDEIVKNLTSDDIKNFVNETLLKQNNCKTVIMLPEDLTENNQ